MPDKRPENKLAYRIVKAILADLQGRQGLGDEWEQIAPAVQREIRATWTRLARTEIAGAPPEQIVGRTGTVYDITPTAEPDVAEEGTAPVKQGDYYVRGIAPDEGGS